MSLFLGKISTCFMENETGIGTAVERVRTNGKNTCSTQDAFFQSNTAFVETQVSTMMKEMSYCAVLVHFEWLNVFNFFRYPIKLYSIPHVVSCCTS
ncbi:unnamed protein product [Microthlaspi erraticum]|uniref:Uncharacterized protein n=1 Tax=Microthlaspi erraticum TaxID=1685480 RepID=A0A6D2K1V2_9BRAS|nr:unnamed protein product [Microthlaspi erraticum]